MIPQEKTGFSDVEQVPTHCKRCGEELGWVSMVTPNGTYCDDCYFALYDPVANTYLHPNQLRYRQPAPTCIQMKLDFGKVD